MTTLKGDALATLERLYSSVQDVEFRDIAAEHLGDDATLAELIEADGRRRVSLGLPVDLERYASVVPDLSSKQDSLDAAIDVTLRSLSGGSRITPQAIETLIHQHPALEQTIRETATLNAAIWSTTGLRAGIDSTPPKSLPSDFGPVLPSGEQRYQLQRLLGQGGFGQVYLALDRQLSEAGHTAYVAIKILSTANRSPWARQRLIEEATKVRRISHPNVVIVLDRGITEQDEDFIVYEYVDGGDLTNLALSRSRMPIKQAAALIARIAQGVHAAHTAGVIHCDLKPGNIMLTKSGEPKVADFGIAVRLKERDDQFKKPRADVDRIAHDLSAHVSEHSTHGPVGNVAFISPEQFRGEDHAFSVQSDVYALGGMLYLLLTGELPNGASMEAIAQTHNRKGGRTAAPSPKLLRKELDSDLDAICRRAMAVNVADRYNSAAALSEDLVRWAKREPIAWLRPGIIRILSLWARRKPGLAASVVAIVLLAIGGSAVAMHFESRARDNALEAKIAQLEADQQLALRERSKQVAGAVASTLKSSLGEYRVATEMLTMIWALEYLYGPKVMGLADGEKELWKSRIKNIRNLVETAKQEGRADNLETLLWESALGFWLVCEKDFVEAQPLLEANYKKWRERLSADDLWLADLQAMLLAVEVNRLNAKSNEQSLTQEEFANLQHLEHELHAACLSMPANRRGTAVHYLILNSIADLCGPKLLNQPQRQQQLINAIAVMSDRKKVDQACP